MMLSVQMGQGADAIEQKGAPGHNTHLTGIRRWTGAFTGAGDCVSLFALLTPLGSVHLLDSRPLNAAPRIRATVAELLDPEPTRRLECDIARTEGLGGKLRMFGAWLEARATARRQQDRAALRAGRAAMRLCAEPELPIDRLADEQHVSRRQLERDFTHWLGASPRHLSQVARVQSVARKVRAGLSLAAAAADAGFADQSHMTRVVRQLTGLTPREFVGSGRTPIADVFRAASGGATVYL
jgi:AraC-like DNA-binding protein